MNKTTLIMAVLAVGLTIYAYTRGPHVAWNGVTFGAKLFVGILPNMLLGFLLGGMVTVLLPRDMVSAYAGEGSGFQGMLISTIVGAITPAGPFVTFPLVLALWKAGAGVSQLGAFLTSWSLLGLHRIMVYELPILGWRFMTVRVAAALVLPFIVGSLAGWLYRTLYPGHHPW